MSYEESLNTSSSANPFTAVYAIEKLRPHLANLMGRGGFRALLSRALALASAEVSWLHAVRVDAGGSLGDLRDTHLQLDKAQFREGSVVLVAGLLGLLEAFIGPALTLRQISGIWPTLTASLSVGPAKGGQGEKTE